MNVEIDKKTYVNPTIINMGTMVDLTQGSSGSKCDQNGSTPGTGQGNCGGGN